MNNMQSNRYHPQEDCYMIIMRQTNSELSISATFYRATLNRM